MQMEQQPGPDVELSIVVPIYNEIGNIDPLLDLSLIHISEPTRH